MTCHKEKSPGLYKQWYSSKHADHNVTCLSCHGAKKSEPDAFMHEGAYIATLVTPKDCGNWTASNVSGESRFMVAITNSN